jgi:hypothetical protein
MEREKLVSLSKRDADTIIIASAVMHGRIIRECKEKKISVAQAYYLLRDLDRVEAALVSADLW